MNTVVTMMLQIIAIGGGAAALAYGLFVWLGKRWLEQHFAKSLERLRHEQAKEIEHVRHEINSLFSRVSKIHDREFEVLPTAWKLLHKSFARAFQACSPLREFPQLSCAESHLHDGRTVGQIQRYRHTIEQSAGRFPRRKRSPRTTDDERCISNPERFGCGCERS